MNIKMIGFFFLTIFSLTIVTPYLTLGAQINNEIKTYSPNDEQKFEKGDLVFFEDKIYEATKTFVNNSNNIENKLTESDLNKYITGIDGVKTYDQIIKDKNIDENKLLLQSSKINLTKSDLADATKFSEKSGFMPSNGVKIVWTPFLVWAGKILAGRLLTKLLNYGTYQFCRYYNDYNWETDLVCDVGSPAHRD